VCSIRVSRSRATSFCAVLSERIADGRRRSGARLTPGFRGDCGAALGRPRYVVARGPDHAKRFFARSLRERAQISVRRGDRAVQEAGRAVRRVDLLRFAGRDRGAVGEECRSYLRSNACAATSKRRCREEDQVRRGHRARSVRRPRTRRKFHRAAGGPQDRLLQRLFEYSLFRSDGPRPDRHLGMWVSFSRESRAKGSDHTTW